MKRPRETNDLPLGEVRSGEGSHHCWDRGNVGRIERDRLRLLSPRFLQICEFRGRPSCKKCTDESKRAKETLVSFGKKTKETACEISWMFAYILHRIAAVCHRCFDFEANSPLFGHKWHWERCPHIALRSDEAHKAFAWSSWCPHRLWTSAVAKLECRKSWGLTSSYLRWIVSWQRGIVTLHQSTRVVQNVTIWLYVTIIMRWNARVWRVLSPHMKWQSRCEFRRTLGCLILSHTIWIRQSQTARPLRKICNSTQSNMKLV